MALASTPSTRILSSRDQGKRAVTTIYLRPEVLKALQNLSEQRDIPMAQLLREAVNDLFVKYQVKVVTPKVRK